LPPAVTIDRTKRTAHFDFTGTGAEVFGNTNAPRAVTYSAIIYTLRCLVGQDVPLNQGCLAPVTIHIPEGTLLHPSPTAAVVGGNVLTSQRVVDVVLKAFGACAASQGCMNNLTLGDDHFGYYEVRRPAAACRRCGMPVCVRLTPATVIGVLASSADHLWRRWCGPNVAWPIWRAHP